MDRHPPGETKGVKYKAGTKPTDFFQANTEGAKNKGGTKQTNTLQAETEGGRDYLYNPEYTYNQNYSPGPT